MLEGLTRRLILGALAGTSLTGCAAAQADRETVQVNIANGAALPSPGPDEDADQVVQTGFDAQRRVTVDALINGQGPFRLVVDTGANRTVLSTELAETLGLVADGQAMVHGIAGMLPSPTATLQRLDIGDLVSRRLRTPLLPRRYLGADGLLGVDVLARRRATLDFQNETLLLASGVPKVALSRGAQAERAPEVQQEEIIVEARHRFGQLTIVDAALGATPLTAFLDSGAEITVGNEALGRVILNTPGLVTGRRTVQLVSATGQLVSGELAQVPPLRLGGVFLGNLTCVFADLHTFKIWDLVERPAMLIGMDVMKHFDSIELNFADRKVAFRSSRFNRRRAADF